MSDLIVPNRAGFWVPGVSEFAPEQITLRDLEQALGSLASRFTISELLPVAPEEARRLGYGTTVRMNEKASEERGYDVGMALPTTPRLATLEEILPFVANKWTPRSLITYFCRFDDRDAERITREARMHSSAVGFRPGHGPMMDIVPGVRGKLIDYTHSDGFERTTTRYDPRTQDVDPADGLATSLHFDNWYGLPVAERDLSPRRIMLVPYGTRMSLIGPDYAGISDIVYKALEANNPNIRHTRESRVPRTADIHALITNRLGRIVVLGFRYYPGDGAIIATEAIGHDGGAYNSQLSGNIFLEYPILGNRVPSIFECPDTPFTERRVFDVPPLKRSRTLSAFNQSGSFFGATIETIDGQLVVEPATVADAAAMAVVQAKNFSNIYESEEHGLTKQRLEARALVAEASWRKHYEGLINNPNATVFKVHVRGEVVGYAAVVKVKEGDVVQQWLDIVTLDKDFRKKKAGLALLREVLRPDLALRDTNVVYAPHTPVHELYLWMGFEPTDRDVSAFQVPLGDGVVIPLRHAILRTEQAEVLNRKLRDAMRGAVRVYNL